MNYSLLSVGTNAWQSASIFATLLLPDQQDTQRDVQFSLFVIGVFLSLELSQDILHPRKSGIPTQLYLEKWALPQEI